MIVAKHGPVAATALAGLCLSLSAVAGPYADDLSKCLVSATTADDRMALVRWMFSAASRHPAVKEISTVTDAQLDTANKQLAELFTRLLTESCREQAVNAIKYEGQGTLSSGFQLLGQVAAQELFSSPEVTAGMAGLEKYVDADKLKALSPQK
jgi:hypothetical protein